MKKNFGIAVLIDKDTLLLSIQDDGDGHVRATFVLDPRKATRFTLAEAQEITKIDPRRSRVVML